MAGLSSAQTAGSFPPLEQWRTAIIGKNADALRALYSSSPPAAINTSSGTVDGDADVAFWMGLKARSMNVRVVQSDTTQPAIYRVLFQATAQTPAGTRYVTAVQTWREQAGSWQVIAAKREVAKLEQPLSIAENIYPTADAHEEIRAALLRARKAHKRVLVIFGADWCYDCHVLDKAFRRQDIAAVLNPNYEVVHVDVGQGDKNQDLMNEYQVPMKRGIPAIALLDSSGSLLYSQRNGEWERARALGPEDLLQLLNRWKPQAR
ncbi:MAG: thioredoxin family protein [Acidobacteria bacterium]|nr:thioredoxin family protein [Acidobacteriota bacterium]